MDLMKYCRDDLYRIRGVREGLARVLFSALVIRNYRVNFTLRLCQRLASGGNFSRRMLPIAKILHRTATGLAGMDLPWNVKVGEGFAITHGWGLVISPGATIGRNVTIFHGATVGRSDRILESGERVPGYPIIEDDVWIGPHAVIVGAVRVGKGSRIAAGCVVTLDVEAASMMAGNPAVLKRAGCAPDVMNRVEF